MSHHVLELYDYHVWTNKRIFDHLKELPQEIFDQEIQSVFPSVSKALSHIYIVDYCWLEILSGKSMSEAMEFGNQLRNEIEAKNIEDLDKAFYELSKQYKVFLNQQEDLDQKLVLDNPYTRVRETSLSEMVLHVVNHGTYHRGNITAMLRQMGHESVMMDYALYWYS